jgi:hypothetical protein
LHDFSAHPVCRRVEQREVIIMSSATIGDNSLKSQITTTSAVINQQQVQQQQSPRNAAQPNNSGTAVKIALVEVSKVLQDGDKFIKWDEVSVFFK